MLCASMQSPAAPRPPPEVIRSLCAWLDGLPLSRPRATWSGTLATVVRARARLSGAEEEAGHPGVHLCVLVAEIVKHFHPRLVDLHSYVPASSTDQKLSNWSLLNRKVFHKLHFYVSEVDIQKVVANKPGTIESILCALREKMEPSTTRVALTGTADPGLSSVDAEQPWAGLITHSHTSRIQAPDAVNSSLSEPLRISCEEHHHIPEGWEHGDHELAHLLKKAGLQSLPAPFSMKTFQNQRALENMESCACRNWEPTEWPLDNLARVQQELEDKEQALAILQETVKILQMKVMKLEHLVQLKDQRLRS